MPEYKYVARDIRGKTRRGVMSAVNGTELLGQVKGQGLYLLSYEEAGSGDLGQRMSGKELSELCRELGTMLQSGITLLRAFEIMLRRDIPKRHRLVYEKIYRLLLTGTAMSDAMEQQGRVFPPLLVNMFRAGEANGTVDLTALRMADHYEKEYRLNNKVKSATTYPIILLILTVVIIVAVFTFILPQFLKLYEGKELPGITQAVISFSKLFTDYALFLVIGVVALVAAIQALRQVPSVRIALDRFKLRAPVLGKLNRVIVTARFARTLSSLYASGLSILTALEIAKGTVGNAYIARQFETLVQDVRSGSSLAESLEKVEGFDKKLCATVAVGEESGRLESMLLSVADSFDYESAEAAQRMVTILEPLCIVIMAVIIGFIMIAVLLPIMDMYDTIDSAGGQSPTLRDSARRLAGWLGQL